MPVVVIANPKGGVGKSTLATHVAGYWARKGHAVVLGDVDRQQSARLWLGLRPPQARPIALWDTGDGDAIAKPPKGSHAVLDTPAGLHGWRLSDALKLADKIIVPLQASIFDIYATREFVDHLVEAKGADKRDIGLVGMRVDERTIAADQLRQFTEGLGLPVLATLRPTQNYVYLAARGLTIFDVAPGRVQRDLAQWQGICQWLEQ